MLLLLCAPKDMLAEEGLTEENAQEWAAQFVGDTSPRGGHTFVDSFALALYYGNKSHVALRKSYPLVVNLHVSPEVLHSLVAHAKNEEFDATFRLKDELARQEASCRGKKRVRARHDKPDSAHSKNKAAGLELKARWASGNFDTRVNCAEQEWAALGFASFDMARKELRNTPDPSPWPAKKQRK